MLCSRASRLSDGTATEAACEKIVQNAGGWFQLIAERPNGCSLEPQRPTRLTFTKLFDGQHEALYVIFNVQECLHICYYSATEKVRTAGPLACHGPCTGMLPDYLIRFLHPAMQVPYRTIKVFGATPSGALIVLTCHAHTTEGRDTADLLIGLSTGDSEPSYPTAYFACAHPFQDTY